MRITFITPLFGKITQERSALDVVVKFWDDSAETWTADTPTTVDYRLDTIGYGTVTDWTSKTPGTSITISLSATENAIIDDCKDSELKQLTVTADRGLSTQYSAMYKYRVSNLQGQT